MVIHQNNALNELRRDGHKPWDAWITHVESDAGKHTVAITVRPGDEPKLEASRAEIGGVLRSAYRIGSNADLEYIEVKSSGVFRVDLDQVGHGTPGVHGQSPHEKADVWRVDAEEVSRKLSPAQVPVPPLDIATGTDPGGVDLADSSRGALPGLTEAERQQVRREVSQGSPSTKPKL